MNDLMQRAPTQRSTTPNVSTEASAPSKSAVQRRALAGMSYDDQVAALAPQSDVQAKPKDGPKAAPKESPKETPKEGAGTPPTSAAPTTDKPPEGAKAPADAGGGYTEAQVDQAIHAEAARAETQFQTVTDALMTRTDQVLAEARLRADLEAAKFSGMGMGAGLGRQANGLPTSLLGDPAGQNSAPTSHGTGLGRTLLPLGGLTSLGMLVPRGEDIVRGKDLSKISPKYMADNWKNAKQDFRLWTNTPLRDVGMHGLAGTFGYVLMREQGHGWVGSISGPLAMAIGIELGQSMAPGYRPDWGDLFRTTLYGSIGGAVVSLINGWADKKVAETGALGWRMLAFSTGGALQFGFDAQGVQFGFNVTF